MAALADIYFKKETLQTILDVLNKKGDKGLSVTVSINDETKVFTHEIGESLQNVSAYVSQSKEDREAKKDRFYVGNGKIFWTDGKISIASKPEEAPKQDSSTTDSDGEQLPF